MAISFVQGKSSTFGAGVGLAYTSNNTAGNLLVCVSSLGSATSLSISDTQSNTWVQADFSSTWSNNSTTSAFFYALNCKGGANTVTVVNQSAAKADLCIGEYSGINTLDQHATPKTQTTGANPSSNSITTLFANEVIISWFEGNSAETAVSTGFTVRNSITSGGSNFASFADDIVSSTGTTTATWTMTSNNAIVGILSFYQAAAGTVVYAIPLLGAGQG